MPNPFFSGRIPPELEAHVEEYRAKTKESKTDVLINALSAYTGFQGKQVETNTTETTSPVLERLDKVEDKLTEINSLKKELAQLKESLKTKSRPQKTTENDNGELPLFTGQLSDSEGSPSDDNQPDNTDNNNSDKVEAIVCPEAEMIKVAGLTRHKLRYHREKIEQGKEDPASSIEARIKGKRYLLQYRGEEKEGKKKVRAWVAIPKESKE